MILSPCKNLIPPRVTVDDLCEQYRYIGGEYNEVSEAWHELAGDIDNGKKRQHLAEELIDLMTACLTFLKAMEKLEGIPPRFVESIFKMVYFKNYGRGYIDWEGDQIEVVEKLEEIE